MNRTEPMGLPRALLAGVTTLLAVAGCGNNDNSSKPFCPEGQIRVAGVCTAYSPGNPVDATGLWEPVTGTTWQWQLTETIDPSRDVDMYDVDLFNVTGAELDSLAGMVIICYFSAGSWENWRDDAALFPEAALGKTLSGWPDERWLDITNPAVRDLMRDRLDLAVTRGCDGVEPDNMDGYQNANGVGLNATEQLEYNRFIADAAHERGLSVGLKNDLDQLEDLVDWYDWALNEECHAYAECDRYAVFANAGKAVFHVEYVSHWSDAQSLADRVCGNYPSLSTLIKTWDLGPELLACDPVQP
jgi:hypothetical protein